MCACVRVRERESPAFVDNKSSSLNSNTHAVEGRVEVQASGQGPPA